MKGRRMWVGLWDVGCEGWGWGVGTGDVSLCDSMWGWELGSISGG